MNAANESKVNTDESIFELFKTYSLLTDQSKKNSLMQQIMNKIYNTQVETSLDEDGNTPLIKAIELKLTNFAFALINLNNKDISNANKDGNTALIYSINNNLPYISLAIIATGKSNSEQVNKDGNTALIIACQKQLKDVALEIIKTGNSKPDQVNNAFETALIVACTSDDFEDVAIAIIKTGNSNSEYVDNNGETALIYLCSNEVTDVTLELIKTGKSNPEHINKDEETALLIACGNKLEDVAIALISTGKSLPGHSDKNNTTPLIYACSHKLSDVAFKLLETEESKPEQVDNDKDTALINACSRGMQDVAVALIQTEKSNSEQINNSGRTAYDIALNKDLTGVINALTIEKNNLLEQDTIDVNSNGFNTSEYEHKKIIDFLNEKNSNLCFIVNDQYFLTNKYELIRQSTQNSNIKYACVQAGDTMYDDDGNLVGINYSADANIIYDTEYFSLSSLFGLQIIVKKSEINEITSNMYSSRFYSVVSSGKKLVAIISNAYIEGEVGVGADHCQTGKETEIYHIMPAKVSCVKQSNTESEPSNKESQPSNEIKIQYKGKTFKIPIKENTTIGQLKELLLNKLISESDIDIDTNNVNVKFIYKAKMYTDDLQSISSISSPDSPYNITLQSMVTPKIQNTPTGGKRTKRNKKYNNKNGNKKIKITKRNKKYNNKNGNKKIKTTKRNKNSKTKRLRK